MATRTYRILETAEVPSVVTNAPFVALNPDGKCQATGTEEECKASVYASERERSKWVPRFAWSADGHCCGWLMHYVD